MTDQALKDAVNAIRDHQHQFDVTIVCTTDDYQAAYWMDLLENGLLAGKSHRVLAVSEDWNAAGGAGNGLGTLYAWRKACALAKTKYDGLDLDAELAAGKISAALYHTAGKGTRLAPLPASENNNKPGVKLPFPLKLPDGTVRPLAVLEAVVKQTGLYARKGRLSVFWGDQVFLPSAPFTVPETHHIDILCTLLGDTAPTAQEWTDQGLEKYGVIAVLEQDSGKTEAAQVEKVSHGTAVQMLGALGGQVKQVGPSLGSFSVSSAILQALLTEFATELTEKNTSVDTDPGFWMPLTLSLESYVHLMEQKGKDAAESTAHYKRMAAMKTSFCEAQKAAGSPLGLFGAVNVGKDASWWDYGQLKLYSQNSLLLLAESGSSASADLLRQFLECDNERVIGSTVADGATVDGTSYVIASKLGGASKVTNSLLANVTCPAVTTAGEGIVVNCVAKKITAGKGAILYNLLDDSEDGIVAADGQVMVGLSTTAGDKITFERVLQSRMDIDGGKAWKQCLEMNDMSFEAVHKQNKEADIGKIAAERQAKFKAIADAMGM